MIDEQSKDNRERFTYENNARKLDFLPNKYFKHFMQQGGLDYDHLLIFRNKQTDYLIISLYPGVRNEEVIKEGFEEIPSMYNFCCKSYVKKFKNTRTSKIEEEQF